MSLRIEGYFIAMKVMTGGRAEEFINFLCVPSVLRGENWVASL